MTASAIRSAPAPGSRARKGQRRPVVDRYRDRAGILMSIPAFALVGLLLGIPILQAIYYSFTNWNGLTASWVGVSTYTTEFKDPTFWRVLENNGLLLLAVPIAIALPMGIAFLLNERVFGWRFFRSVYFLPTALSWVVIGMVAARFFAQQGSLNSILKGMGLGFIRTDLLSGERTALVAVGIAFIWSMVGTNTMIFLTGMATLDPSVHEAARIDGAGGWSIFIHITVPQLKRFIQFSFTITVISAFTALFSLIFVMTGGGPGYGTTTLEFFVYQTAFAKGLFGTGALLGLVLFVLMALVGLIQLKLLRTKD
jgi:multiple sugar transport system permease protein